MLALAVTATACSKGEDPIAGQLACQQRMVEVPFPFDKAPPARSARAIANRYEALSQRYAAMSPDGCMDDQRAQARAMAGLSHQIATDIVRASGSERGAVETFEQHRIAMQADLERMRAVRLR